MERVGTGRRRLHAGVAAAVCAVLLPLAGWSGPAWAAPGNLDTTFGGTGKVTTEFGSGDDAATAVAVQPDGKVVAAGFAFNGTDDDFALARYNADGSLDTTFGTAGKVTTSFAAGDNENVEAVLIRPDGKIVAVGTSYAADDDVALARYNPDGSLDTTFGSGGKVVTGLPASDDDAYAAALRPDGGLVVAGAAGPANGVTAAFLVLAYTAGGALDPAFGSGGAVTTPIGPTLDTAYGVAVTASGGVVAAGFATSATDADFALVRYTPTGSLDTTFDADGKVTTDFGSHAPDVAFSVLVQPDGKVVASGLATVATADFGVARYNVDGSLDVSFDGDGRVATDLSGAADVAAGAVLQADGKLVVAGGSGAPNAQFAAVRYTATGALDTGFDDDGTTVADVTGGSDGAYAVALQPDGRIVAAGVASADAGSAFALVRWQNDPAVTIDDVRIDEPNSRVASAAAIFTVSLTAPSPLPITVLYATAPGTALSGVDYVPFGATLTFAPGETAKQVPVHVRGDLEFERDETFFVNLSKPTNVSVLDSQGVGTIVDAGYWLVASDGGIFSYHEPYFGSAGGIKLNKPIVGMAVTPSGHGYWLVATDGGIFNYGDAQFLGSTGSTRLNQPIVGMAATPTGNGYWLVAADGGIFAFGDAQFRGSTGNLKLNKPIVGMTSSPTGNGYWLDATDGGIFAFGDAGFFGSTGAIRLNQPMVGMAATPTGNGYWLVASDGGIFAFGDAQFLGSTGAIKLNKPVVGMDATSTGNGYWLVATDGGIFAFGDAFFRGSAGNLPLNKPIVAMASP
ncbi:MAG TPA: Calx-beta domain-containing protein [Acidimicrobiales bacterium]|nr:Calx-beta domain-containing protein [Acidimicrobiales bacterium]